FQAEDGIRDGHVTGVQTCALPICPPTSTDCTSRNYHNARRAASRKRRATGESALHPGGSAGILGAHFAPHLCWPLLTLPWRTPRSEERREGKSVELGGGGGR